MLIILIMQHNISCLAVFRVPAHPLPDLPGPVRHPFCSDGMQGNIGPLAFLDVQTVGRPLVPVSVCARRSGAGNGSFENTPVSFGLLDNMEQNVRELELKVLQQVIRFLGRVFDLDRMLQGVVEVLAENADTGRISIVLRDEDAGRLVTRAWQGSRGTKKGKTFARQEEATFGPLLETGRPFVLLEGAQDPALLDDAALARIHKRNVRDMAVPVILEGEVIGAIRAERIFGLEVAVAEDIRLLAAVADVISRFVAMNMQAAAREELLRSENSVFRRELAENHHFFSLIGNSPAIQEVQQLIKKVAHSRAPVFLVGEPGAGKSLTARIIHELSPRAGRPFVKINCACLPEDRLDSELFGDEMAARTSGPDSRRCSFHAADGGAIFLDDIDELPPALQARLVRFLQQMESERMERGKGGKVDVRIMAASPTDLSDLIRRGAFREDLFYRLNVFPIHLPSLKERVEDIPLLVDHFHERACRRYGRRFQIDHRCMDMLKRSDWPGNVRELENFIERLSIIGRVTELDIDDFQSICHLHGKQIKLEKQDSLSRLEEIERKEITAALERNRWVQSQAARELGLTLRQVGYRIKKFGLEDLIQRRKSG